VKEGEDDNCKIGRMGLPSANNSLSVKMFVRKHKIPVMEHPSYLLVLALYNLFLFPKVKSI
jgi:hypothetical protein